MTATLQVVKVVSMQKGIVQDSSKGKTTKKERNISPHFTAWSTLLQLMLSPKTRADSLKELFFIS